MKHRCRPDLVALNQNLDDKFRASSVDHMRETLPSYLKKVVNLWTGEVSGSSSITSSLGNDQIKIPNPRLERRLN